MSITELTFLHEKVYAFRKPVPLQLREFPAKMSSGVVSNSYFWFTQDNMPNYGVMYRNHEDVVLHRYYEEYDLAGYMLPGIAPYAVKLGL